MDRNKPVMETHGDRIRRERLVFNPITSVVERRSEFDGNPRRLDSNVPPGSAKHAGPGPDATEKALVKLPKEFFGELVPSASAPDPGCPRCNIRLLRFVQIPPIGDPGLEQTLALFRLKRGCIVRLVEQNVSSLLPQITLSKMIANINVDLFFAHGLRQALSLKVHRMRDPNNFFACDLARPSLNHILKRRFG